MTDDLIKANFIKEMKNRFVGLVKINNEIVECFIPNSSKMEKYLKLKNKKVLLTHNKKANGRTKYTLFAVKHYNSYILLNLNHVNDILATIIKENNLFPANTYQIYKERTVGGYKADLFLKGSEDKIIIEAKGIISTKKAVLFPKLNSVRFINQLTKLKQLLSNGWKVHYFLVSLSPFVSQITLDTSKPEYLNLFRDCIELGMKTQGFSVNYKNNEMQIKDLKIIYSY